MIVDLMDATVSAVFAQLSGRAELTALCPVTEHVLQDAAWPLTRIGQVESAPIGGKGEQVEEIALQVETLYRGTSPAQLRGMMLEQRRALEGQALEHEGVTLHPPVWGGAAVDGPAKDGHSYVGIQTFIIIAEPA